MTFPHRVEAKIHEVKAVGTLRGLVSSGMCCALHGLALEPDWRWQGNGERTDTREGMGILAQKSWGQMGPVHSDGVICSTSIKGLSPQCLYYVYHRRKS